MAILEIKNIKKSFARTKVLKGISFELEKGEVLAIIGSSGSGKTTLLRCMNFLETCDTGTISIDGNVIYDASKKNQYTDNDIRKMRLNFGLVFQSFNLFPQYTVLKNIMLAPELMYLKDVKNHAERVKITEGIRQNAMSLLEKVGLVEKADSYPFQLSGGQQQRVAIARAMAMNPQILCFDEPTSALDPELTGEVLKAIKSLKSSDRTMIVVTHEMEFARNVADKVIYMADGVIEEMGTPEQVFDSPKSEKTKAFLQKPKL